MATANSLTGAKPTGGIPAQVPMRAGTSGPPSSNSNAPDVGPVRLAGLPFVALCIYLLTQVYCIPVLKVGPIWTVWPTLNDLALAFLLPVCLLSKSRHYRLPAFSQSARQWAVTVFFAAGCSYVLINLGLNRSRNQEGSEFGLFYMYRLFQAVAFFWCVTEIPLDKARVRWLTWIFTWTFVVVCVTCIATFFRPTLGQILAPQIPASEVAGPWRAYGKNDILGLGTIGFNHAYGAMQVLLLLAMRLHYVGKKQAFLNTVFILLALLVSFFSGSRAGFGCMALYALLLMLRNPMIAMLAGVVIAVATFLAPSQLLQDQNLAGLTETQGAVIDPAKAEQFTARLKIWQTYFNVFAEQPLMLLVGTGIGGSADVAGAAHNMPLMLLAEFGLGGLLMGLYGAFQLTKRVYQLEQGVKPLLLATLAIGFSCLTQETLYPVPAMGHFLPLYLGCLALCAARMHPYALQHGSWDDAGLTVASEAGPGGSANPGPGNSGVGPAGTSPGLPTQPGGGGLPTWPRVRVREPGR